MKVANKQNNYPPGLQDLINFIAAANAKQQGITLPVTGVRIEGTPHTDPPTRFIEEQLIELPEDQHHLREYCADMLKGRPFMATRKEGQAIMTWYRHNYP